MILMLHHLPQVERLDLAEAAFAVSVEDLGNGEFFDLFDVVVQIDEREVCLPGQHPPHGGLSTAHVSQQYDFHRAERFIFSFFPKPSPTARRAGSWRPVNTVR